MQKQRAFKFAILYSKGTEQTLQDFFMHKTGSDQFFDFLNILGQRIKLKGWKKYRGDFGVDTDQDSYYTEWNSIKIMFHVSPYVPFVSTSR